MDFDHERWLREAQVRLSYLRAQRAIIDQEIEALERVTGEFVPLSLGLFPRPIAGLTASMREVFRMRQHEVFSPTQIRDELKAKGLVLNQRNPLAAIHQILSRLVVKREVTEHTVDGRNLYRYAARCDAISLLSTPAQEIAGPIQPQIVKEGQAIRKPTRSSSAHERKNLNQRPESYHA